jgi:hypothetical protein
VARPEAIDEASIAARATRALPAKTATLTDLYDPLAMPAELLNAHTEPNRAVEKCYRPEPFHSDRERVEFLFPLHEKLAPPLLPVTPRTKSGRSQAAAATPKSRKQRTLALPGQAKG